MLERVVAVAAVVYFAFLAYVTTSAEWVAFDLVRSRLPEGPDGTNARYVANVYEVTLETCPEQVTGFIDGSPATAARIGLVANANARRLRRDVKGAMGMTVVSGGSAYELVVSPRFFEDVEDKGGGTEKKPITFYAIDKSPLALPWASPDPRAEWPGAGTTIKLLGVPRG